VRSGRYVFLFVIFLLLQSVPASRGDDLEDNINSLKTDDWSVFCKAVARIHKYGKAAIPGLISHIDNNQKISFDFRDPISSIYFFGDFSFGMACAYMIELILDQKLLNLSCDTPRVIGVNIYTHGFIVGKGYQKYLNKGRIKPVNLKSVQKVYRSWWKENSNEDLDTLIKSNSLRRPLSGSEFGWI
jgi:hypothetical protein